MLFHLRSRHIPLTVVALLLLTGTGAAAAQWLATRTFFDGPRARVPVVVLAPLLMALVSSVTLAGADTALDDTAPRLNSTWRAAHGALISVVPAAVLALCATSSPTDFGSAALVRNGIGLTGLVLLSAAALPAAVSWAPTLVYALTVYLAAPHQPTPAAAWWAWPMQRGSLDASWIVAGTLWLLGLISYAVSSSATHARLLRPALRK